MSKLVEDALKKVIAVDFETSTLDMETSEICEIGHSCWDSELKDFITEAGYFGVSGEINANASAIHGISNNMVKGLEKFTEGGVSFSKRLTLFNDETEYLVAHNATFEQAILNNSINKNFNDNDKKWICTYRLARHLYTDSQMNHEEDSIPNYSLNYLYFRRNLCSEYDRLSPHQAGPDSFKCLRVFEGLLHVLEKDIKEMEGNELDDPMVILNYAYEICWSPINVRHFPFGKHKGQKLEDIPNNYYEWALKNMDVFDETSSNYDHDLATSVFNVLEERL